MIRRQRRKKGSFLKYGVGLFPSAVAEGVISKGAMTGVSMPVVYGTGAGIAAFIVGLYFFNKKLIKYKQAKAKGEIDKQKEAVSELAKEIRSKKPEISKEKSEKMAHKALEIRWIQEYDRKRKPTLVYKDHIYQISESKGDDREYIRTDYSLLGSNKGIPRKIISHKYGVIEEKF